jgi:flavin reductase (DIM6/NTAB) family NADH-FMN oxidoreductase RutF
VCSKSEEGEARFQGQHWKENDNFIYAKRSLSNIFCECSNLVKHTSHTIFIGNVISVLNSDEDCPLIYGSGKYLN